MTLRRLERRWRDARKLWQEASARQWAAQGQIVGYFHFHHLHSRYNVTAEERIRLHRQWALTLGDSNRYGRRLRRIQNAIDRYLDDHPGETTDCYF
jgi:hypothetical protein